MTAGDWVGHTAAMASLAHLTPRTSSFSQAVVNRVKPFPKEIAHGLNL